MNFRYGTPRKLVFAMVGMLALAACSDDPTGVDDHDEHGEADQVQLVMNGQAIATFTFETNSWVGELDVEEGEETPHIDVNFLDHDGDVVNFNTSEFYLLVEVENTAIAEFEQDTPGEFGGHLHGEEAGVTNIRFSLMHGAVGSGHADLVTDWVHAHVGEHDHGG